MSKTRLAAALWLVLSLAMSVQAIAAEPPRIFDSANWQELTKTHKGQPMIVHFWGLTCGNCMVELKDWGQFAAQHPGVPIVFVNWDRRSPDSAHIDQALAKAGLGSVASFALADGFEEKLRFAVDHDWMGELPYTRLIASDGTVTTFSGAADFTKLSRWLTATAPQAR